MKVADLRCRRFNELADTVKVSNSGSVFAIMFPTNNPAPPRVVATSHYLPRAPNGWPYRMVAR